MEYEGRHILYISCPAGYVKLASLWYPHQQLHCSPTPDGRWLLPHAQTLHAVLSAPGEYVDVEAITF